MEENNKPEKKEKKTPEKYETNLIFGAIKSIFKNLMRITTGLIGLFGLAYMVGWATSKGYYSSFGAEWLAYSQSIFQTAGMSLFPLGILFIFVGIKLSDIFDKPEILENDFFWKFALPIFFIFPVMSFFINKYSSIEIVEIFSKVKNIFWVLFYGLCILETIQDLIYFTISKSRNIGRIWVFSIYVFGSIGLYFYPYYFGKSLANYDVHPDKSKLPIIKVKEDRDGLQLRLLFKSNSHVYTAEFKKDGPPYNIKIIPIDQIDYIEPHRK